MIKRQNVVERFFGEAEAMRGTLDKCFADAFSNNLEWQYFHVPRLYTYLRTVPARVFPAPLWAEFMQRLRTWSLETLGQLPIDQPFLHLMIDGCRLELHSDFHNGTWGYVYSLTRWQTRKFAGGETLLMRDGVPSYKRHHVQGNVLYELVPAEFNQLLVFDDRIAHATPVIEGSMDPVEGRIALVGHLRASSPVSRGALDSAVVRAVVSEAMPRLAESMKSPDVQGTIAFRLSVGGNGAVESVTTLMDNLVTAATGYEPSNAVGAVRAAVTESMERLSFPSASAKSSVIVSVLVPLPDQRPIQIAVSHALPMAALVQRAKAQLGDGAPLGLLGAWEGDSFMVQEPLPGSLRIEPRRIAAYFEAPMWVPSQRDKFQSVLTARLEAAVANAPPK